MTRVLVLLVSLVLSGVFVPVRPVGAAPTVVQPMKIYVVDPGAGTHGRGALFELSASGQRTLVTDFGFDRHLPGAKHEPLGRMPIGVAVLPDGTILVIDREAGGHGQLFTVDPNTGSRAVLSDFGDKKQGPRGDHPQSVAVAPDGTILVGSVGGTKCPSTPSNRKDLLPCGLLFTVDRNTGQRVVLSDFGHPAQGPADQAFSTSALAVAADGTIYAATHQFADFAGLVAAFVVRVDPATGWRTVVADRFRSGGVEALAVESDGMILAVQCCYELDRIDPVIGKLLLTRLSDLGNAAQGPIVAPELGNTVAVVSGSTSPAVTDGTILVSGQRHRIVAVDPLTGMRRVFSAFDDPAQGPTGQDPCGIVVVPGTVTPPPPPPPPASDMLFVANAYSNAITVYDATTSGGSAPLRSISGATTGLDFPVALALDNIGKQLFVANVPDPPGLASITVYDLSASGDVAPVRTLSGANTGLSVPAGIAVDRANNELLVANAGNNSITVYGLTDSGDTAPKRTLVGAATGLNIGGEVPASLVLDLVHDELLVTNFAGANITVYTRTASGNTAPLRALGGSATHIIGPTGLALDLATDEVFVVNPGNDTVLVFSRTASANTAPLRILVGPATGLAAPQNPALNAVTGELFVPNAGANSVTVYAKTASGNTAPLRTISGQATGLAGPLSVAVGH